MPQIEQLQVVHWGPLRPDPVEFTREGINVATGPNGSGKTCLLDAAKLLLGVDVDDLKQRPADYIFDGGGDPTRRADHAYVKAIFANPERPGRAGRVFADAGRGCELAEYVTAICEVTRERRRYTILPGAITWGEEGRRLEDELKTLESLGRSHWFGPRRWADLLSAAGVSRALLGVISVRQGETDRTLDGTPEDLLRRMLELTGKQQTLDDFRSARAKLAKSKADYGEVAERFRSERRQLDALNRLAARHEEYLAQEARRHQIEAVELPTAERRQLEADLEATRRDRDARLELLQRTRQDIERLDAEIPQREQELRAVEARAAAARAGERQAQVALSATAAGEGTARATLSSYEEALRQAEALLAAAQVLDDSRFTDAVAEARQAEAAHDAAEEERDRLEFERDELAAGRPRRPDGLDAFRETLRAAGIESQLVAERLEVGEGSAAEAALHDGVWALVVAPDRLEAAVSLAREHGHRLPLAAAGAGRPRGVFADARELPEVLAYLEEVDVPLVDAGPGVDRTGVVRGRSWAAARAPQSPVLGALAREEALRRVEARLADLASAIPDLFAAAVRRRQQAETLAAGLRAAAAVEAARETWCEADETRKQAEEGLAQAADEVGALLPRLGEKESELRRVRGERDGLDKLRAERERDWEGAERRVAGLEADVAAITLTAEQQALGELPTIEALRHELELVGERLAGFSDEERSELVLAEREEQAQIVAEVEELLAGRREDLERVEAEVETAKERYDTHIRQTVHALARAFRDVCAQAGMEGDIQLAPSAIEGEAALDVRVAHQPGEPKRSYRSGAHSGGEKAKISLLLLLAAMSVDGAADLLIVDEHSAHLDSRNIDAVGELMDALKSRVQFILATPTNAEAGRLTWCDEQLAFFPREPGEPYAPPIRLFTRLPEPERAVGNAQLILERNGATAT